MAVVCFTWLLWAVVVLHAHYIAKRAGRAAANSGVSLAPIIPLAPVVFFGLAKLLDLLIPPWGTWLIGGLHIALAVALIVTIVYQLFSTMRKLPSA